MADPLSASECERFVMIELAAASSSKNDAARIAHLNRASVYAHLGEMPPPDPAWSSQILGLIETLSDALVITDRLRLTTASIHIDAAIMALGGSGTAPPVEQPAIYGRRTDSTRRD